jgi:pyruvate,water dikinase
MVYTDDPSEPTKDVETTSEERNSFVLKDDEILLLAKWSCIIEDHYSERAGQFRAMDIEWAKDGDGVNVGTGKLFIVQARPETVHSQSKGNILETYVLKESGNVLISGQAVGTKIGQGKAHVIKDSAQIGEFKKGEVLITSMTDPDWEPIMKIAAAIVTDKGGRTCHAAIISRELGIPCLIGTACYGKTHHQTGGNRLLC